MDGIYFIDRDYNYDRSQVLLTPECDMDLNPQLEYCFAREKEITRGSLAKKKDNVFA